MDDLVIPSVGLSGFYELRSPFDTQMLRNEQYTCQAVRKISEYLANNEDIKANVYDALTIPETDYEADLDADMPIISLQADTGHWIYVPARYVVKYPIVNGIPYRSMMIGVSLPPIPTDRDLSFITTDIENLVRDSLGITPNINLVETSKVLLVPRTKHNAEQASRALSSSGRATDRSRYIDTQIKLTQALQKIAELEAYILANPVT